MALDQELSTWAPASLSRQAERILDIAERLVQTRGFNGFSYADVAAELGVTKASLHYHFISKTELGRALLLRFRHGLNTSLTGFDTATMTPVQRLRAFAGIFTAVLAEERMCLCGMLAAEVTTLPAELRGLVNDIFRQKESWVARVLDDGRRAGVFQFAGTPADRARVVVAIFEGAMLIARSMGEPERLRTAIEQVYAELGARRAGHSAAARQRPAAGDLLPANVRVVPLRRRRRNQ